MIKNNFKNTRFSFSVRFWDLKHHPPLKLWQLACRVSKIGIFFVTTRIRLTNFLREIVIILSPNLDERRSFRSFFFKLEYKKNKTRKMNPFPPMTALIGWQSAPLWCSLGGVGLESGRRFGARRGFRRAARSRLRKTNGGDVREDGLKSLFFVFF